MEEPQGLRGTDNSGNHQTEFAAGQKDNYGPWMVVARRKNGGKLGKGLDLTKNLADPNLQGPMSHHAYSATKLDQNRVGKRKAIVGQNSLGQVIRENSFCALVEPIKQATTKYKQPIDHDDELPRPFTSEPFSPSPQTFDQGQCSSIRGKKGLARARAPLSTTSAAPLVNATITHTESLIFSQPSNYLLNPQGPFQFSSPSAATVGDQLRGDHSGDSKGRGHEDQSNSNACEGLDQLEVSKGRGVDFSLDKIKQKMGLSPTDGLSVGLLERRTKPEGREEFKQAIHSDCNRNHGKPDFKENLSSVLSEDEAGNGATSMEPDVRDRSLEGDDGTDGMEFDGGGQACPTN
nr:hypothetical protein CFP56_15232 [Quercus suber]